MGDTTFENGVVLHPDGVEIARLFETLLECWDRVGGVSLEEAAPKVAASITGDDRIERILAAVGTVDIAVSQGAAFQHAKLVEQEVREVAGAVEMPFPGSAFLITMGRADGTILVSTMYFIPQIKHAVVSGIAVDLQNATEALQYL